jgi:hypothetical protein
MKFGHKLLETAYSDLKYEGGAGRPCCPKFLAYVCLSTRLLKSTPILLVYLPVSSSFHSDFADLA